MQAIILSPIAGWQWARDGFTIFRKQPLAVFMWAMTISLFVLLATAVPPIGPLVFIAFMPMITLLTLSACEHLCANRVMLFSMWLEPLKQPGVLHQLISMGLIYGSILLTAGLAVFMPFADEIAKAAMRASSPANFGLLIDIVQFPLLAFALVYVILSSLFWYAPVLTAWHKIKLTQALFYSGIACWRNKWPFLVYGATWIAIFSAINLVVGTMLWLGVSSSVTKALQMLLSIVADGALYCSFYPAYISVFGIEPYMPTTDNNNTQSRKIN